MAHTKARSEPIRDPAKLESIRNTLKENATPRDYLLFVLGVNTALRLRDLLSLRVCDVVDSRGRVRNVIPAAQPGKGSARAVLNASCRDALRYYLEAGGTANQDTLLFAAGKASRPLGRTQVWRLVNNWCRAAGLAEGHFGAHTLRKTWGYMALRHHSIPIGAIQAKFNHATPGVTRRYLGVEGEKVENVESRVNL